MWFRKFTKGQWATHCFKPYTCQGGFLWVPIGILLPSYLSGGHACGFCPAGALVFVSVSFHWAVLP